MWWLVLVAVLMVGGCATEVGPSPAELKAQWEAQNVFPQNYKADLMAYMRTYLNDPTHIRAAAGSQPQPQPGGPAGRTIRRLRALRRAQERRTICRSEGRRRDLCVEQARPLPRRAERGAGIL